MELRQVGQEPVVMVGVAGMLAASFRIAGLRLQARAASFFGLGLTIFSLVVAAILLVSFLFVPIVALLIWLIVVSIVLMRGQRETRAEPAATSSPSLP